MDIHCETFAILKASKFYFKKTVSKTIFLLISFKISYLVLVRPTFFVMTQLLLDTYLSDVTYSIKSQVFFIRSHLGIFAHIFNTFFSIIKNYKKVVFLR